MLLEWAGANRKSLANPAMWSILTLLLVPGLNAVQPTTYEMSDSRPRCGR
jgi:hypothetical protein